MVLDNGDYWEPEDFQVAIVEDLLADFVEVWAVIPEGSAKTTLMSGVGLYWGDYTPSGSIVLGAASREQAMLLFLQAAGFVERSPRFRDRFKVQEGTKRIKCLRKNARLQVYAADDRTGDGVLYNLALLDELHRHRDMRLYRTWRGKADKRDGKICAISTAGEPGTEFEDARAAALRTATDVTVHGSHTRAAAQDMVLHDFSVPKGADVEDMTVVKAANPLSTVTVKSLAAKRRSPSMTEQHWRRFVCNQAVRTEDAAISPREWGELGTGAPVPAGEPVDVGADFGWKHDTTALVPLWDGPEFMQFGSPEILVPPRDGQILRPQLVKDAFERINDRNPIRRVVLDPDRASEIAVWLEDDLGVEVVEYIQSNGPMVLVYERWMEAMRNRRIRHSQDPIFTEHVLNAMAKTLPDGSARFERPSSSRAQAGQRRRVIDGVIAAGIVYAVAQATPDDPGSFVFEVFG